MTVPDAPIWDLAPTKSQLTVAQLQVNALDDLGRLILQVYDRRIPKFAIYQTDDGVFVQYADDPAPAEQQRSRLQAVAQLRQTIRGETATLP